MNQNNQNSNSMFMNNNYPPSSQNGPPIISNMQKFNQDYKPEISKPLILFGSSTYAVNQVHKELMCV